MTASACVGEGRAGEMEVGGGDEGVTIFGCVEIAQAVERYAMRNAVRNRIIFNSQGMRYRLRVM
jgi:hypothetical protein